MTSIASSNGDVEHGHGFVSVAQRGKLAQLAELLRRNLPSLHPTRFAPSVTSRVTCIMIDMLLRHRFLGTLSLLP